ncbi:MAG: tripartite tricarboxylate transporter substrate binding protein [Sphaerochaetaceae bacterium]|nr:tripartite tricarboxylate transporter substrate binding protein [Sphaerochaetaceae bacterium]
MKRILTVVLTAVVAISVVFAGGSSESSFPDPEKPITIIVPQGAGGGTDLQTRTLAAAMEEITGQKILVENVTGGSTGTGTNQVIDSPADGYTLLMYGTYVVCGTMTGNTIGHEGLDFISGLSMEPFMIAVQKDSQFKTLDDFIKYAKANPGKVTIGNAGATATTGVVAYGLDVACGKVFNVIDCNGGAELIPYVIGKHIDAGIFSQSEVKSNINDLRPLVFLGSGHSVVPEFAKVPNLKEAGYGDLTVPAGCFRGICAPKGTPDAAKKWLANAFEKAYKSDAFQNFLKENGLLGPFTKLDKFEA